MAPRAETGIDQELVGTVGVYNEEEQQEARRFSMRQRAAALITGAAATFGIGVVTESPANFDTSSAYADGETGESPVPMSPGDIERIDSGLPDDVIAIANITSINIGRGGTFLAAYEGDPSGGLNTSTVNTDNNQIRPNAAFLPVDSESMFNLRAGGLGDQFAVVDIRGYLKKNPYTEIFTQPVRVLDTREYVDHIEGMAETKVNLGKENAGRQAMINLTTDRSKGPSYSAIYPCSEEYRGTSNLNLQYKNDTRAILTLTEVDENGDVCIMNLTEAVGQIGDLLGFLDLDATEFKRIVDTRDAFGGVRVQGGQETAFKVGDPNTVVVLNVTAIEPSNDGFFTVDGVRGGVNDTSNGNIFKTEYASAALVMERTDEFGNIYITTNPGMDAHFAIDGKTLDPNDEDGQVGFADYLISAPNRVFDNRIVEPEVPPVTTVPTTSIELISSTGANPIKAEDFDFECTYWTWVESGITYAFANYVMVLSNLAPNTGQINGSMRDGDMVTFVDVFQSGLQYSSQSFDGTNRWANRDGVIRWANGSMTANPESVHRLEIEEWKLIKTTALNVVSETRVKVDEVCNPIPRPT